MARDEEFSSGFRFSLFRTGPRTERGADASALDRLLVASNEAAYCECLDELVEATVSPIIVRVVGRRCGLGRGFEIRVPRTPLELTAEDIRARAMVRVMSHLRGMWQRRAPASEIADFERYVRACATNAWSDHFRHVSPQRRTLEHRVLSVIDRTEGLTRWATAAGERLAGRLEWSKDGRVPASGRRYERFLERPHRYEHELGRDGLASGDLYALVPSVVGWVNAPLPTADLISVIQALLGQQDPSFAAPAELEPGEDPWERFAGAAPSPQDATLLRARQQQLWRNILQLPPKWRSALLLGPPKDARADQPIHYLWETAGISLSEIAAALGEDVEELARLYNALPLGDELIARRLGVVIGTVSNCRSWARQRLSGADEA